MKGLPPLRRIKTGKMKAYLVEDA